MKKYIETIMALMFTITFLSVSYFIGRDMLLDYRANGLWDVMMTFIIGIPTTILLGNLSFIERRNKCLMIYQNKTKLN
jgi:RsiW-degrading membrane proteinase PrsW (M82 family)